MTDLLKSTSSWIGSLFSGNYPLVPVKSTIDGRTYRVRDMADKQEAANLMATVRMKIGKLCNLLQQKYPDKAQVKMIIKNFRDDPDRFMESTPDASHTSYSVNKGEEIHLCLRQRGGQNESLVNENVMTFVGLHELAHVCTESVGHGPDFWNNFGWLLKEAEANGIYQYTDFQSHPVTYCGVSITDSPRYDPAKDGSNLQIGTMTGGK
jgi:WLM domain